MLRLALISIGGFVFITQKKRAVYGPFFLFVLMGFVLPSVLLFFIYGIWDKSLWAKFFFPSLCF